MRFPKTHLVLVAIIGLGLASFVVAKFQDDAADDRFSPDAILSEIPEQPLAGPIPASESSELPLVAEMVPEPAPEPLLIELAHEVRPGDSTARIFTSLDIPQRELKLLERTKPHGKKLAELENFFE